MEFCTYKRLEVFKLLEKRGVLPPIFIAYKTCDNELVVEDYGRVRLVHDVFYSSRLFLDEDALIEFDVLFWMLWEEMPSLGQNFHGQS